MGYHAIDLLTLYFGELLKNQPVVQYCFEEMRKEGLEDLLQTNLFYAGEFNLIPGVLAVSRHHYHSIERFEILGTKGSLVIEPNKCTLTEVGGEENQIIKFTSPKQTSVKDMLREYMLNIENQEYIKLHVNEQFLNVKAIESIYSECKIYQNMSERHLSHNLNHASFQTIKELNYEI